MPNYSLSCALSYVCRMGYFVWWPLWSSFRGSVPQFCAAAGVGQRHHETVWACVVHMHLVVGSFSRISRCKGAFAGIRTSMIKDSAHEGRKHYGVLGLVAVFVGTSCQELCRCLGKTFCECIGPVAFVLTWALALGYAIAACVLRCA